MVFPQLQYSSILSKVLKVSLVKYNNTHCAVKCSLLSVFVKLSFTMNVIDKKYTHNENTSVAPIFKCRSWVNVLHHIPPLFVIHVSALIKPLSDPSSVSPHHVSPLIYSCFSKLPTLSSPLPPLTSLIVSLHHTPSGPQLKRRWRAVERGVGGWGGGGGGWKAFSSLSTKRKPMNPWTPSPHAISSH